MTSATVLHIPAAFINLDQTFFERLDSVTLGVFDCPHSTPQLSPLGPLIVRTQDIITGVLRVEEAARVSEETYSERVSKAEPTHGDLLYSREGTYFGIAAEVPENTRLCLGQRMVLIRPDRRRLDTRYLKYWLNSPQISNHIHGFRDGSVAERLNLPTIRALPVFVRPLNEQQAIAGVLGTLDDKIEQNRQISSALEGLAQAMFRAWFVDFEPVRAKATGATSFPSMHQNTFDSLPTTFTDSALRLIPEGWAVNPATEVADVAIGKTPPRKEPQWFSTDPKDIPWASIADMGSCGTFLRTTSEYLKRDSIKRFNIRLIPDKSVLYSFKLTLGRVAIADGEIATNEAIAHFVPKYPHTLSSEYLFCYLQSFDSSRLGSTSSIATATNSKAIKAMPILIPNSTVAREFTVIVRPVFDYIRTLSRESAVLAELRDYLLPKLLNGSLSVGVNNG